MIVQLTTGNLHETLLRDVVHELDNEADALAWMTLLHTHQIRLHTSLVEDAPGITTFAALTQRQAAAVVSTLWKNQRSEAARSEYWYHLWNEHHAYEVVADIPAPLATRMRHMRALLGKDSRISSVEPES